MSSENIVSFNKIKEYKNMTEGESCLSSAFRSLQIHEKDQALELKQTLEELLIQNNKVIPLSGLIEDFGMIAVYTIGLLEREKKIFRLPCTDYYLKLVNIECLPLSHCCNLNTLRPAEYALTQLIEADLMLKTALRNQDSSDTEIFKNFINNIPSEKARIISYGDPGENLKNINEARLLIHFNDYGFISENTVIQNRENNAFLSALQSLEAKRKIIRISGSRHYIKYVPNMGGDNSFVTKFEYGSLNEMGVNALIDIELKGTYETLKFYCKIIPMLENILLEQFLKTIVF